MTEMTDPAQEFAVLCRRLRPATDKKGAEHLADLFDTKVHSEAFYQILFTIVERAKQLKAIVSQIEGTAHIASEINNNISNILRAFQVNHLAAQWKTHGSPHLQEDNVAPILILSAAIRPHISYPALTDDERAEILADVETLLVWLEEHQLNEQDFVRQALIEGLRQFAFRIERTQWFGWGYTFQSIKDVIGAYSVLERGYVDDGSMPIVGATLKKVAETLRTVYAKAGVAKDAVDRADFFLRAYGAASMIAHAKVGGVVALLTFGGPAT